MLFEEIAKIHQFSEVNKFTLLAILQQGKAACKILFVFTIDTPKLIKYYKIVLRFREITDTNEKQFFEYAAPDYDEGYWFMYYSLT